MYVLVVVGGALHIVCIAGGGRGSPLLSCSMSAASSSSNASTSTSLLTLPTTSGEQNYTHMSISHIFQSKISVCVHYEMNSDFEFDESQCCILVLIMYYMKQVSCTKI